MKAAVVPAVNEVWRVQDVPRPVIGPGQVLIRVRASGLCYTDVRVTAGDFSLPFPLVLGHEPAGEIVEVGAAVTSRKVGDRVGVICLQSTCGRCEPCESGRSAFCTSPVFTGVGAPGGHAEFLAADAAGTMLLPDGLSYEQAAPIFCAGYTVWSGLCWAEPKPGETVAVLGIGGLGHLAVQYAKAAGFRTIAVSHSPDKAASIRALGADEVVSSGEELLRAGGADVLLGTGNSTEALEACFVGVRPDGRVVPMGLGETPLRVPAVELQYKRTQIVGSQHNGRQYLYQALQMVAAGKVKVLTETYSLDEAPKVYERVREGKVRFRAVLTMD